MSDGAHIDVAPALLGFALALAGARAGSHLATRLRVPAVLGELGAGIALGAALGGSFARLRTHPALLGVAELGVMVLLFEVGLDTELAELRRVGRAGALVAIIGVAVPSALGALASWALNPHASVHAHLFVGATLAATSVGITARVLRDLGQTRSIEARVILAAAVLDDVLGLLLLALVTAAVNAANQGGGAISLAQIGALTARALGFLVAALTLGRPLVRIVLALAARWSGASAPITAPLALCLLFGWAAHAAGLAAVVGAFVAGLLIDARAYAPLRGAGGPPLEEPLSPVAAVFVPTFFVLTGAAVDVRSFANPRTLFVALVLSVAAVVGKLVAGVGAAGSGARLSIVGIGMIPRGEVGLLFAAVGASLSIGGAPVISPALFGAVVFVVVVTTVLPPPLLARWARAQGRAVDATNEGRDGRETEGNNAKAHVGVHPTTPTALQLHRASTELAPLVEAAVAPLRPQAAGFDVSIRVEGALPEAQREAQVDAAKIAFCVATLVGNALRHVERGTQTRQGGSVVVSVRHDEARARACITVRDDGPGIAPAILERLFAPPREGALPTGFALPLVRAIVEAHGGALELSSSTDEVDHGTTATLVLPYR